MTNAKKRIGQGQNLSFILQLNSKDNYMTDMHIYIW